MLTEEEFRALASRVDRRGHWPDRSDGGALNFLTTDTSRRALDAAVLGEVLSCCDRRAAHRALSPNSDNHQPLQTRTDAADDWVAVNERVTFEQHGPGSMTHLDALGHFYYEGSGFDNATPAAIRAGGVSANDITTASHGIVGRGYLIDLPRLLDVPYLPGGRMVEALEIAPLISRIGPPESGDILFVRTGRPAAPIPDDGQLPGVGSLSLDCVPWIHDSEFSLIISDAGMDTATPLVQHVTTPWHVLTLTKMGIRLVDFADLEALAAACAREQRWTFMAVVAALPWVGATASPVNPIAVL